MITRRLLGALVLLGFALTATAAAPIISGPANGVVAGLPGGSSEALVVTQAAVIKATPGRLVRIVVNAVGSGGALTLNDVATTGGATANNQIATFANSVLTAGQVIYLDWPCTVGIVVSAVTTGGSFSISFT